MQDCLWWGLVKGDNDNDNENHLLTKLYREKHVINTIHIASYIQRANKMNNNSGISTLTMGAEVILMCPKFISTVTLQTNGEQELSALCKVENI